ncbi:MAG TPA: carbon-nitrogen hydrolase family protein [Dehalococcoidia bacterium]|jgi:predicted amidohydrolase|nr:carbon-nitrogen hydrolase family protein [Dehalococcoidia bacterium]|tara:strand:+ start:885 stop:1658 length:774 start_codon:yes stop_codon:yes gene_type:complete
MNKIKISLLHLSPITGDLTHNKEMLLQSLKYCADIKSDWVITPELWLTGYSFQKIIGTDWITIQPDLWTTSICNLVKELNINLFLSLPEKDSLSGLFHNTIFVINRTGEIIGKYRKIKVLPQSEGWSTPGDIIETIDVDSTAVGIMVCADAYRNKIADEYASKGARLLISPSAWGPGDCAPNGEWEQRSLETGMPVIVCNRTGTDLGNIDWTGSESVVACKGKRLLTGISGTSTVFSFNMDLNTNEILSKQFEKHLI